jgi:aminopeptidase
MKENFLEATRNILEKNLNILDEPFVQNKLVLVYDKNSKLSVLLSESYISNLENYKNLDIELIDFDEVDKEELKNKLLSLKENSTVILVQSTNFRLDNFRIRLNLHNSWIGCLEHNHLSYIKDVEIKNYADSILYKTPYYISLSEKLKNISDNASVIKVVCKDWNTLNLEGGFEDMKQNTWDYTGKSRWWTFPIWENFTEIKDFSKSNWKVSVKVFPNKDFEVVFPEIFSLEIKESKIISYCEKTPKEFIEILDNIKNSEDNEIMCRELWFWLNPWITFENPLNDINSFERMAWFHISLWKKHGVYRKKLHRKIIQRYHIDIFLDVDYIEFDWDKVFEGWKYLIKD